MLVADQVVAAIAARLAPTVAADRVTTDRAWPLQLDQLPAWKVVPGPDAIEVLTFDGVESHDLVVECQGYVAAVSDIDVAMSNLAAAGLAAIHAVPFAGFTVRSSGVTRTPAAVNGGDAAVITVRLQALFNTQASAPEAFF